MADFALGLTKTAVEGTLSRIKSAIEEESKLRLRVQNDLVFITGEFEMMQSFLSATNRGGIENNVVRTWVRQLRDLAFDVEDCIELVIHLDNKSAWWWRLVPSCMAPPLPLDQAVTEIRQLKARVEDVSHRNTRYNLIGDSSSILVPVSVTEKLSAGTPGFHILRKVWEDRGRQHGMCDLQKLISCEGSELQVISVWGSTEGDLGTASIFRKAYCDPKICKEFKICIWVKLMHPFNPDEFVKSLLTQFYASSHQANAGVDFWTRMSAEVTEDNLMKAELMQQMSQQRHLIVLENVLTVADWGVIRMYLPDSKNGSRIVVSTPQLGIALLCTGEPYQVSELRHFSDEQFLCAFFKKGRRDMGEFKWQLRSRGVISVWGTGDHKSILVDRLYKGILNRSKEFDEVEFGRPTWVDVPDPFNLKVFAQRLLLNFHSDDIRANEIAAVGKMGEPALIQRCSEFLLEEDYLMVINALQSMDDWDLIKSTFLSKPTKGCILVITNEETVATHCVKDHERRALSVIDLEADAAIGTLIKDCGYYGPGGKKGRLFSNRRKDALDWTNKFKLVGHRWLVRELSRRLEIPDVIPVWGTAGVGKSALLRDVYYKAFLGREDFSKLGFISYSWVDVPYPFDLMDFSWRLLLDFYSDDNQSKETAAVGLMHGQNPIQECCKFLREEKCFVVIDGLRSAKDWDLIEDTFLSKPIQSSIIVTTTDKNVAAHCNPYPNSQLEVKDIEFDDFIKDQHKYLCLSESRKNASEWTKKFEPVGRHREEFDLSKLLRSPGVVSVWGIAGVGKSSLVRSIYYIHMLRLMKRVKYRYFQARFISFGWVDVPHPFNLTEFSWSLLLSFHSDDLQAKETVAVSMMEGQDPVQECCKFLREDRCFVVIDSLRRTHDWDLIKATFLSEPIKSSVVVITTEVSVAMHCVENEDHIVNIKCLEAHAALNVFKKIAWDGKQLTLEEMKVSKTIVTKCGGLPKVISAIGEHCKSSTTFMEYLSYKFMRNLEAEPKYHSLRTLFSWMQSYFDACSDSIKPCIFYLSIFSVNQNIRRRRLLRRWIAEGYCRDTSSGTAEENGEKYVSELANLSIIQKSRSEVLCQVNGFFHEYIISRPMEDNLVFALEGRCSLNSRRVGQHLTIRSSWDRNKSVFESIEFSRLRSLTVFGKWMPFFISYNMKLLRTLDLEDTSGLTNDDLEQIGKLLPRLKFLSLRGCREITSLRRSVGGLRQLQTLDVRHTSIVTLPLVITKLPKLQYIRAGSTEVWHEDDGEERASSSSSEVGATTTEWGADSTAPVLPPAAAGSSVSCSRPRNLVSSLFSKLCRRGLDNGGVKVPAEIGRLVVLHTLGVVNVNGKCGKSFFEELVKLTQLRKLGVSGITKGNIKEFCLAISGHAHLKSLSVELDKDDNLDGLDVIPQPPKILKKLKLSGRVEKLLVWIDQPDHLEKLNLDMTIEEPEDMRALELPDHYVLRHIRIRPIIDGELQIGQGIFCHFRLKVFEIECSSVLHVNFAFAYFEVLKVHCSRGSSFQISGLERLMGLKELWLKGSYGEALRQDLQRQIDVLPSHREKPVLRADPLFSFTQ